MKLSLVVAVLDSHEVVRRQVLHYRKMPLPDGVEVIFMDDGSDPPLCDPSGTVRIVPTGDTREWTWAVARNSGARIARGEYLLLTDIDYIVSLEAIRDALAFTGDKLRFKREFGVLDENGDFTQDKLVLHSYGLSLERMNSSKGVRFPPHPNNFVIRRALFLEMGGYVEHRVGRPYPQREDGEFKRRWMQWVADGKASDSDHRPTIYMFPNGQYCGDVDSNPFGLFHNLTRKTKTNPWNRKRYA